MEPVRFVDARLVEEVLDFPSLIDALRTTFRAGGEVPPRPHYALPAPGATLLLMPAWQPGHVGVKVVSVFPGNTVRGLPSVAGLYLLLDGDTGMPRAVLDGTVLTRWRTAAASALAASFLARQEAAHLLMVGAGALAPYLIRGHAAVRPLRRVSIWNRTPERAACLAGSLKAAGFATTVVKDLKAAAGAADLIVCATLSTTPLIRGAWLKPGVHLDLVGGYTPAMRETDDTAIQRAQLFVDTRAGALREAGDLVQPLRAGLIRTEAIRADLFDLCRNTHPGRTDPAAITLFKSVGTALEDLAAARLILDRLA